MCDPVGLSIYTIILLFAFIGSNKIWKGNRYYFLLILIVAITAAFREGAGVDTPLYILRFENSIDFNIPFIEPFFPVLMNFIKYFGGSFVIFSLIYGAILAVLYYRIFKNYPNSIYFALTVFPVIYVDSLFNGLRIGLAYPLIILAISERSVLKSILAALSHISSIIIFPLFLKGKIKYLGIIVALSVIILFDLKSFIDLTPERYISKFNAYSELDTKNIYSGIADSVALFSTLLLFFKIKLISQKKFYIYVFISFLILFFNQLFLVNEFVFILRIIRLSIIIIFGFILCEEYYESQKLRLYALSFGIIYMLNFLRQIIGTCSYENGFLPLTH